MYDPAVSPPARSRWPWVLLALCAVGLLFWWRWPAVPTAAEGPPRFAHPHERPAPAPSSLVLPLTIPLDDLAASVEQQVPEQVLQLEGEPVNEGWSADLDVRRPGPVVARGQEDRLVLDVPLRLNARAYRTRRAARRAEKGKDTDGIGLDFDAILEVGSVLSIDEQWSLGSQTALEVRWNEVPTLDLGPLRIPIRKPVEKQLVDKLAEVAAGIDERLAERDPTRAAVERAWAELASPRPLSTDPPVWLVTTPQSLSMSDLVVHADRLELLVGYTGTVQTVLGDPGPAPAPAPLPARTEPPEARGYTLVLPVVLGWQALSDQATAAVRDQIWTLPGADAQTASLRLTALELYPSGDLVALRADYVATHPGWTTDGRVFFTGRPTVDPEARTVVLADFTYVLDTWDSTVWSTNALVQSGLEDAVGERLVFPYGDRLDAVVDQANGRMAAGRTSEGGATTTGTVDAVDLLGLAITDAALVVDLRAVGTLAVEAAPDPDALEPGGPRPPL